MRALGFILVALVTLVAWQVWLREPSSADGLRPDGEAQLTQDAQAAAALVGEPEDGPERAQAAEPSAAEPQDAAATPLAASGGVLIVSAVDPDGEPLPAGLGVAVESSSTDAPSARFFGRLDAQGQARIEGVPLRELSAVITIDSFEDLGAREREVATLGSSSMDRMRQVRGTCAGPRVAGEVVTLELTANLRPVIYRGRLVEGHGGRSTSFYCSATLARRHVGGRSNAGGYNLSLGQDGEFHIRHWVETDEELEARSITFALKAVEPALSALAELPLHPRGELNLGTLELRSEPLVVAGHVVDVNGDPVPRVTVRARVEWPDPTFYPVLKTTTDAEGWFAVHGQVRPSAIGIRFTASGHLDRELADVRHGTDDLRVELAGEAVVIGHVLHDPGQGRWLRVTCVAQDGRSGAGRVAPDGSVYVPNLPPGPASVRVVVGGVEALRFDTQLRAGANRDERLDPFDLRGRLRTVRLDVVGPDGNALPAEFYRFDPQGAEKQRPSHRGTSLEILCVDAVSGILRADGHAEVRLDAVTEDQTIELPAGIEAFLRCSDAPAPARGHTPILLLVLDEPGHARRALAPIIDGVARVAVPRPGRYAVHVGLASSAKQGPDRWDDTPLLHIDVPPGGVTHTDGLPVRTAFARLGF